MVRKVLSDAQWERIAPELPGKQGDPGRSGEDNRLFVEAVLWLVRTGSPWRDLPDEFGKWKTVYTRFWRWADKGKWESLFNKLAEDPDFEIAHALAQKLPRCPCCAQIIRPQTKQPIHL